MVIGATFDFGRKKTVKSNGLSRLHSFDIFLEDGNTSENDVLLTLWHCDGITQVALVAICTNLSARG